MDVRDGIPPHSDALIARIHAELPAAWATATTSADTRHGPVLYPIADDPIGLALREYGEWAIHEFEVLRACAVPGSTVLDVGANIGTHTLGLARAVGSEGRVVAIEPQRFIHALLEANVRVHALDNVSVILACAGETHGAAAIPQLDPGSHSNFGAVVPMFGVEGVDSVPVLPLDSLGIDRASLLKVDVEGAEGEVLRGAATLIDTQRPVVYFETNSVASAADPLRFMWARGYTLYFHRSAAFNPDNFRGSSHNRFGFATETNVLAVPPERLPSLKALALRTDLFAFSTLDAFAELLLESPRYGDISASQRSPAALFAALSERNVQLQALRAQLAAAAADTTPDARPQLDEVTALSDANEQNAQLEAHLGVLVRQVRWGRARIGELEAQIGRRRREKNGLTAEIEALHKAEASLLAQLERANKAIAAREALVLRASEAFRKVNDTGAVRAAKTLGTLKEDVQATFREGVSRTAKRIAKRSARMKRHARERAVIEQSGAFDPVYYLAQGVDTLDPLQHFLETGAGRGLDPCADFDTSYYVKQHAELAKTLQNPFVHYLTVGRARGDAPKAPEPPAESTAPEISAPVSVAAPARLARDGTKLHREPSTVTLPTPEEWHDAQPHPAHGAVVDVIVPVYRGYVDTLRCVQRVLASRNRTPFELIVVDDCSPEPDLSRELVSLAERGFLTYLRNAENLGFVGSVNLAMRLHPERDVLLLNSDTEVFHDWVDRLRDVVERDAKVGTVTPFSNSATICSYPLTSRDNDRKLELSYAELDTIAAHVNPKITVEIPTAVGFCMYIQRECLSATGYFDEERFGKGYGEENDFCRRALAHGYVNVMACDVFVRHTGGTSFQGEKAARSARAMEILDELHPDYRAAVHAHAKADPVLPHREQIDLVRLKRLVGERTFAILTHERGGGTEKHVQQIIALAKAEGVRVLVLRPFKGTTQFIASIEGAYELPNLTALSLKDPLGSARFLNALGIAHLHVHHLLDLPATAPDWVTAIATSKLLSVDFTVHDYSPICPQITLIDASERYCGEPTEQSVCNRCISTISSRYGIVAIGPFRRRFGRMLASMRRVFVPNEDVQTRLQRYFPELETTVVPHPEQPVEEHVAQPVLPGEPLRVAVLGAVGVHKGYDILLKCALDAKARELPLEFSVVGYTSDDARAVAAGIRVTGAYESNAEGLTLIAEVGAQVGLFPAVWPETYSYTLTLAESAGLHPVAFDFGAIAQRLQAKQGGTLLPIEMMTKPEAINDALVALRDPATRAPVAAESRTYTLATYYGALV